MLCSKKPFVRAATDDRSSMLSSNRPNFVALIADDMGVGDLPCVRGGHALVSCDAPSFGHPFADMPNVARLQAEGTRFLQAYTLGITCSPSRAALMTGRMPPQANANDINVYQTNRW